MEKQWFDYSMHGLRNKQNKTNEPIPTTVPSEMQVFIIKYNFLYMNVNFFINLPSLPHG